MMVSSRYYQGPGGEHVCWNVEPTFQCPLARVQYDVLDMETGETRGPVESQSETVGITYTRHVSPAMAQAAAVLGVDGKLLERIVERAHHSNYGRLRVNGKLTDRCKACGGKMDRLGFRVWVDRPIAAGEETEGERTGKMMARRMGFAAPMRTVKSAHVDTKREAIAWARDELAMLKSIAAEVA
jgi:hypothetical protein